MSLPMMVSSSSGIPSEVVVMMVCVCVLGRFEQRVLSSSILCCRSQLRL